ncbi:MAG: hypothetical protein O2951_16225 [Bacteroidetes bacterium]|nr:hypothetical protein [Bacteroidota bacterium]
MIVTQGPGGDAGANWRDRLAKEGKYLPLLGDDNDTANRNYIKQVVFDMDSQILRGVPSDKEVGKPYGLEWAERFHYIGPQQSKFEDYIKSNALKK